MSKISSLNQEIERCQDELCRMLGVRFINGFDGIVNSVLIGKYSLILELSDSIVKEQSTLGQNIQKWVPFINWCDSLESNLLERCKQGMSIEIIAAKASPTDTIEFLKFRLNMVFKDEADVFKRGSLQFSSPSRTVMIFNSRVFQVFECSNVVPKLNEDTKFGICELKLAKRFEIMVKIPNHALPPGKDYESFFEVLQTHKPFVDWCDSIDMEWARKCILSTAQINVQSVDMFGPRIGFIKFQVKIEYNNNECKVYRNNMTKQIRAEGSVKNWTQNEIEEKIHNIKDPEINSIVFMRGGACAMLVVIHSSDGIDYAVLTVQPRLAIGKFEMVEIPAGMIDNSSSFAGVAAKELKEEAGIEVKLDQLKDLSECAVDYDRAYPSCGGCDEFMKFYLYETNMDKNELETLANKVGGAYEEGETIRLKVVRLNELARHSPDMKTLSALYLYEKYLKQRQSRSSL